jgi:hypothetical protein
VTRRRIFALFLLSTLGPLGAPARFCGAAELRLASPTVKVSLPPEVVRGHCSVCHSFRLVEQQRLDRANWDWVMEDMIVKYGATWIDERLREQMVDYLVEHYGPQR